MHPTLILFAVYTALSTVSAFSFTTSTPSQCDDMQVSWTGGSPPFQLLLTPVFGTPRNISIPDSAFSNGKGTFSLPVPIAKDKKFMLTMSDSKGFGTGGTTPILVSAASLGGSCDVADPGVKFEYQLNHALQQCRPYIFEAYTDAIQPVTILAIIPGGETITLSPPNGPTSFTWIANVRSGNTLVFVMIDAAGRQGGSSNTLEVGPTDESSCLARDSPSSTASSASPTTPTTPSSTSPTISASSSPSSRPPVGAILGTILGALIFLAVSITLGLFLLRRKRERNMPWNESFLRRSSQRMPAQTTFGEGVGGSSSPYHYPRSPDVATSVTGHPYLNPSENPFNSPYTPSSSSVYLQQDPFNPPTQSTTGDDRDPFTPSATQSQSAPMSAAQRKAAMAGNTSYKPSRFIVHTDIDDTTEDEVVELPPQYSARHAAAAPAPAQQQDSAPLGPSLPPL